MARIGSFPIDKNIQDQDAWIGTEATNRVTRQFTAQGVADYLNINSKISISAQMVFKFVQVNAGGGDITDPLDINGVTTLDFTEINTIRMSVTSNSGMTVTEFMAYIDGSQILINEQKKIDEFGHYKITSYVLDAIADPLFATLTLEYLGGTGLLVDGKTYDAASFFLSKGVDVFIGATNVADGTSGIVPKPLAGQEGTYLKGDGNWTTLPIDPDTTYDLDVPVNTTSINLAGSDGTNDAVSLFGGGNINITRDNANSITFTGTDTGLTDVTLAVGTSVGAPLTFNITANTLTLTSMAYDGGDNIGYVPTGGDNTLFLRGDGSWIIPPQPVYNWTVVDSAGATGAVVDEKFIKFVTATGSLGTALTGGGGSLTDPFLMTLSSPDTQGAESFTNTNAAGSFVAYGTVNADATGAVDIGGVDLTATGVASSTTFLRGDNIWATPIDLQGVETFTNEDGTYISAGTVNTSATGDVTMGIIDLSAVNGATATAATRFLSADNKWEVPIYTDPGVVSVITTDGSFIDLTPVAASDGAVTVTADLSAGGTADATTFLRGDNTWNAPVEIGTVESVSSTVAGDALDVAVTNPTTTPAIAFTWGGTSTDYVNGEGNKIVFPVIPQGDITKVDVTAPITGGGATGDITIGHAAQTDTAGTAASTLAFGGTFDVYTGVTTTSTGHVSGHEVTTFTMPADPNINTTYSLNKAAGSTDLILSADGTTQNTIQFAGTTNEVTVTGVTENAYQIGLPDDVTIGGELTVTGTSQSSFGGQVTIPPTPAVATDAASKGYVDGLVSGGLTFKGTFNASTGEILSGTSSGSYLYQLTTTPPAPFDPSAARVEVAVGDFYVVETAAGQFYGNGGTGGGGANLDIGDSVIGVTLAVANASVSTDWSIIQSDEGVTDFSNTFGTFITGTDHTNAPGAVNLGAVDLVNNSTTPDATKFYRGDATWATVSTDVFTGADGTNAGTTGIVPAPAATDNVKFLRGDATWATVSTANDFLTGLAFNTTSGVLTATVSNQSDVTVDLDGRYFLSAGGTISGAVKIEGNLDMDSNDIIDVDELKFAGSNNKYIYGTGNAIKVEGQFRVSDESTFSNLVTLDTINNAATDTDKFLVSDSGEIKYRTGAEVRSDIGAGTGDGDITAVTVTAPITGGGTSGSVGIDISTMGAATATVAGLKGAVPASAANDQLKFLRADATWVVPNNDPFYQTISGSGSGNTDSGIILSDSGGTVKILGDGTVITAAQSGNTITLTGVNTWVANSLNVAGYVAAPGAVANKVWKTDASGNPAWRTDDTGGTGTVTSVTAGTGMTQTGTSTINPTLNVIGGNGITVNADNLLMSGSYTGTFTATNLSGGGAAVTGVDAALLDSFDYTQFGATLAAYGTTSGSSGRIRCTAPFTTASGKMFTITIDVYSSYTQHTYKVSGYMYYPNTNTSGWYTPQAVYTGTGTPDIIVGRDTTGLAYISIANGNYAGVRVHSMTRGYTTTVADTYDPWTISITGGTENSVTPSIYNQTGTVKSVAISHAGNAFGISGSPVTSTGTLGITMAGGASQYINGAGNLTAFPSIPQGTVTSVATGNGITGGTITTTGTVSLTGTYTGRWNGTTGYYIKDTRASDITPADSTDHAMNLGFTNQVPGNGNWQSYMQMKGWSDGYASWQIIGPSTTTVYENWYLRAGKGTTWNTAREIWHTGNLPSGSGVTSLVAGTGISLTNASGPAVTVTATTQFSGPTFTSRNNTNAIAVDSATSNMSGYTNSSSAAGYADGGLFVAAYSSSWVSQIFSNFRTGQIAVRGKNGGTWQAWRTVWDSVNLPNPVQSSGVTSVATGNGLTGGTITSTGTLTMSGTYSGNFNFSTNNVVVGGNFSNNPYNSTSGARLMFGSGDSNAIGNYYIGTNLENFGGNYTKLSLAWHTGIKIGAQAQYGGVRFYDDEDFSNVILNVGVSNTNVGVVNDLTVGGNITVGDSHFIGDDSDDNLLVSSSINENLIVRAGVGLRFEVDGNATPADLALNIDNAMSATFGGYVYIPTYLFHAGDTNTRIQFTTGTVTVRGDTSILLDGPVTANQNISTNSVYCSNVYNSGWFRNNNSNEGLYNTATGNHWSSQGGYWDVGYSGTNGIRLRNGHNGTILGYLYAETSGQFGLLDKDGNWTLRTDGTSVTELRANNIVGFQINSSGQMFLPQYTSTSYKTSVTPINPIQSFYPSSGNGSDTTTDLGVDQSGNIVRTTQEATWRLTASQVNAITTSTNGVTLLSAPGSSNLFVIVEKITFMIEYSYNGSQMSGTQQYQIKQNGNQSDVIAVMRGDKVNDIVYQGGNVSNYGIYEHDNGYASLNRTYLPNTPVTIRRSESSSSLPSSVSKMFIKMRYRVYDAVTF